MATNKITEFLEKALRMHKENAVIMVELPTDTYFQDSSQSVKSLLKEGFEGVYISFQRPFKNVSSMLEQQGMPINKLIFIDVATAFAEEERSEHSRCIHISTDIDIDELVRAIYTSLPNLKSKKKFIFIDSLTTIALYKPLSETMRFCEFMMHTVRNNEKNGKLILILNVSKDLVQKRFIKDIALHVDEVISIGK